MTRPQSATLLLSAVLGAFALTPGSSAHADPLKDPARNPSLQQPATPRDALAVLAFWREAGPKFWFAKDAAFDIRFRDAFAALYNQAARGELKSWRATADGAFAEIILLDQYPRNAFRGTPWMYATDALAREAADAMVKAGHDQEIAVDMRVFCYLPFGHSEALSDQERAVALAASLPAPNPEHAREHRDIIVWFGRFPHRNPILGRTMTGEEQDYLDNGGYKG